LPPRERKVIGLYYYGEATMKQIGAEIGVNESRVSQLHARAVQRLRKALGADCPTETISPAVLSFQSTMRRLRMAKAEMPHEPGVVLQYRTPQPQAAPSKVVRRKTPVRREPIAAAR
jgi:RNA polymerase sigma factor for flagellar operon FliA